MLNNKNMALVGGASKNNITPNIAIILARLQPLLLLLLLKFAPETRAQDFTYTINNGMIGIEKYTASGGSVTIPSEIDGMPVTSIGDNAFENCTSLTNVTIPNSITSIGNSAFYGCSSLKSVTIPNSVTSIGSFAFNYCTNLASVTISKNVTTIVGGAFGGCTSLIGITVDTINPNYSSDHGILFNKSQTTIIQYPAGGEASVYTIPNSVTHIGSSAFLSCSSLTNVTIPNSVTEIGGEAFQGCIRLAKVTIPDSVTSIGDYAFYQCASLIEIIIPNSVTCINAGVFSGCASLTDVTIL